ncbi:MAG: amino acid ABC transporter substrate-binding protein [Anaerolineae bacterium]|nr:amino acid ABC transporter substrate-binding protein [Anaerolineae bacterium]
MRDRALWKHAEPGRVGRVFILSGALLAAILILHGAFDAPRPSFIEALPTGVLRVGIDASNPPFAFAVSEGYAGLEIDLSRMLADGLGAPLQLVGLGYDGLYDALSADRVDVIIAATPIDLKRSRTVSASPPYFNAGLMLIADHPLRSMEDLPGQTLAFEYGSVAHAVTLEWLRRVASYGLLPQETPDAALDTLRTGTAEAALVDAVSARLYLRGHEGWHPYAVYVTDVLYAVISRIDRPDLSWYVAEGMSSLLRDGEIETLIAKWL